MPRAAGRNDLIEGLPVDAEVLDHRERFGAPGLDIDLVPVLEQPHVQLARGRGGTTVRDAVDDDATHAADALAAVVIERNRLLVLSREVLVEKVEHLQERHVLRHAVDVVLGHPAGGIRAGLAPDT